jgi:branched-chain amino acid transport system permease protein
MLLSFVISGLGVGAVYALSGVGLVILYRTTGVLNFAFGAIGALGAFFANEVLNAGYPAVLGWLCSIGAGAAVSCLYGRLVAPLLAPRDPVVRAVGTLGFALILLGTMGWYWGDVPRRLALPSDAIFFEISGTRLTLTRIVALGFLLSVIASVTLTLMYTRLGLAMRALADDRRLSSILGVRVISVELTGWLISGVSAGICGVLLANLVRLQALHLTFLVIPAIAAAIMADLSSLAITAVAGIAIGVIEACLTLWPLLAPYRTAAPFFVSLLSVFFLAFRAHQSGRPR